MFDLDLCLQAETFVVIYTNNNKYSQYQRPPQTNIRWGRVTSKPERRTDGQTERPDYSMISDLFSLQ